MRKLALFASVVAVIATCGVLFGTSVAGADPGNGNGASVVRDPYGNIYCNTIDTSGNVWTGPCDIQIVTTPNGTVNETLKFAVDPLFSSPLPGQAVKVGTALTGQVCDTGSGAIYYKGTVTPSGNVSLKCTSNPNG
jgi:hypothetical protein